MPERGSARLSRVLIVDDEAMIANSLLTIFARARYEARAAFSAEQAVTLVREWIPDLIIVDVILPRMNGIDLSVLLQALCPEAGILLFSGQTVSGRLMSHAYVPGSEAEIPLGTVDPHELMHFASRLLVPGYEA